MNILEPLLLGLSTGPFCLGYCAPMLVPFFVSEHRRFIRVLRLMAFFLTGRLIGYLLIGILSGMIANSIDERRLSYFELIASFGMGVLLLLFGIMKNFPRLEICKILRFDKTSAFSLVILGLLTGLNLCPPFIAAIAGAVGTGAILKAVTYFLCFFLGTSVVLLPICAVSIFTRFTEIRYIARICILLSGIWLVAKGIGMLLYRQIAI